MRTSGRITTIVLVPLVLLTALLVVGATTATAHASEASPSGAATSIDLVNQERRAQGIATLSTSSELNRIATDWSRQMAAEGRLYHNPNMRSEVCCSSWRAENVGTHPSPSSVDAGVRRIHEVFMGSSGHRANILETRVDEIGVGVVQAEDGSLWITQVFRGRSDGGSSGGSSAPEPSEPKPSEPEPSEPAPSPSQPPSAESSPAPDSPASEQPTDAPDADEVDELDEEPAPEVASAPSDRAVRAPRLDPSELRELKVTAASGPVGEREAEEPIQVLSGWDGRGGIPFGELPGEYPWTLVLSLALLTVATTATVTVSRRV